MKRLAGAMILVGALACPALASQEPAAPKPQHAPGTKPASPDAPFIGTVSMDGLAEIELGRLAADNASSPDVRQFAQRMVDDHQRAGEALKAVAAQKDVTLAIKLDDEHRKTYDGLAALKGPAFDKAYMAHMVKAHLEAVALFQKEGKAGQDPDVQEWAAKTLPMIQEHLKAASSINARLNPAGK